MAYRKTRDVRDALAAKRELIVTSAVALLERTGEAGVIAVAAKAGVATGTLYVHFPDARELVAAAIARRLKDDLTAMDHAQLTATKPIASAAASIAVYINRARKCRGLASITADVTYRNGIVRAFEARITAAKRDLDPRQRPLPPELAAAAIYGALNAVLITKGLPATGDVVAPGLVLLALQMMGVSPRSEAAGYAAAGLTIADVMP